MVQRTGWGKSAVYFIATAPLRDRAPDRPYRSPRARLRRNQVDPAKGAGIQARTINSANTTEWDALYAEVTAGQRTCCWSRQLVLRVTMLAIHSPLAVPLAA